MTHAELQQLHQTGVISTAELEVLDLTTKGLSDRIISIALDISRSAVRDRRKNAARKIARHRQTEEAA